MTVHDWLILSLFLLIGVIFFMLGSITRSRRKLATEQYVDYLVQSMAFKNHTHAAHEIIGLHDTGSETDEKDAALKQKNKPSLDDRMAEAVEDGIYKLEDRIVEFAKNGDADAVKKGFADLDWLEALQESVYDHLDTRGNRG